MLNFAQFINENWDTTAAKKQAMLVDFCEQYGYEEEIEDPENPGELIENPVTRTQYFNYHVTQYIRQSVEAARLRAAREAIIIEELIINDE
jgi:hypothetical protein